MFKFADPAVFLTWLVFLPAVVALVISLPRLRDETIKWISLATTFVVFLMSLGMIFGWSEVRFQTGDEFAGMQNLFAVDWIPSFGIQHLMGIDGISFPLVALTAFISLLAMAASWPRVVKTKGFKGRPSMADTRFRARTRPSRRACCAVGGK